MRSPPFTMAKPLMTRLCLAAIVTVFVVNAAQAQRVALIAPNGSELDKAVTASLIQTLSPNLRSQDVDMSWAAYSAVKPVDPFNMTAEEARRVGSAVGCNFFVLTSTDTRRRASIDRPEQFESFAAIYVVNSRTGLLAHWKIISASARSSDAARSQLLALIPSGSREIIESIQDRLGSARVDTSAITELPDPDSPDAKGFKSPVPYRRIKPEYTRLAYLYDVTATVEATVDLDENGVVQNIAITRWAGFGLDESVEKAIRAMNWRPAERNGKPLASRFLVRYNFRKIEKNDADNE